MKVKGYEPPHSSFLSVDKDLSLIISKMLENERLKKLLYYTTPDALKRDNLNEDQTLELINKNIKTVPKLYIDGSVLAYIIISFDNFVPSGNPEFRDNVITFDIVCHFDQWQIADSQLRPYRIAAEIDTMFNEARLTGIGKLEFMGTSQIVLNDEFAGLTMLYQAVHGGEDENYPLNPADEKDLINNFNKLFNV